MEKRKMKNYLQLQCCMLVALLSVLPQFNLMGFDLNVMAVLCQLVACVGAVVALVQLSGQAKTEGKIIPVYFLLVVGLGILTVLGLMMPRGLPDNAGYMAALLLGIALFMSKNALNMTWRKEAMRGAYLILLALCLHLYNGIDNSALTKIGALVGLVLYFVGLGIMVKSLDDRGIEGCSKLKIAVILGIVSVVIDWIPFFGWLATVLVIIAFVFEFLGYGLLKTSSSLGAEGQNGAGKLRLSMIILLVGAVLGFIPAIGSVFEGIAGFIALFLVFLGWSGILLGMETEEVHPIKE